LLGAIPTINGFITSTYNFDQKIEGYQADILPHNNRLKLKKANKINKQSILKIPGMWGILSG